LPSSADKDAVSLWSAVTCHRFEKVAICRDRMLAGHYPNHRASSRPEKKAVTRHRTPKASPASADKDAVSLWSAVTCHRFEKVATGRDRSLAATIQITGPQAP